MDMEQIKEDYFTFDGRINRKIYIKRFLILIAISFFAGLILGFLGSTRGSFMHLIVVLVGGFAGFAQHIKRLHDLGKSAWWSLLIFIPIGNLGLIIYLLGFKGNDFTNEYGPDPLANDVNDAYM